jgi:integrase
VFESFGERACPKNLGAINERLLSRYAAKLRTEGRTPATIQGHLAYLKAALKWAVEQKMLPAMPKVAMPKVPKKQVIRKISAAEFSRLLDHAPDDTWVVFLSTAWFTGMRRNEMLDLGWEGDSGKPWVDFAANRIRIPAAYNKSDTDQWIPLHPDLSSLLKARRRDTGRLFALGTSPPNVSHKFTRIAKAAGLRITLHDLRRSFGSRYASAVPAPVLKRLMRHADIKTTLTFYTDVDDVLDEAIRKA